MEIGKTLYITERKEWRKWLSDNHDKQSLRSKDLKQSLRSKDLKQSLRSKELKESEIWLIFYKKSSGKKSLKYNDSVEEALCYGWIDSLEKRIDDEKYALRFTPRKKNSNLSATNIERVKKLISKKKMTKAGLDAIAHAFIPEKD